VLSRIFLFQSVLLKLFYTHTQNHLQITTHAAITVLQCVKYRTVSQPQHVQFTAICGWRGDGLKTTNMCREAYYLRCSWLICRASCCFFLCSKCQNPVANLQPKCKEANPSTESTQMCAYSLVFTLWQCVVRSLKIAQCQTRSPPVDSGVFITYSSRFQKQ
jgi:hypothetical protein